jgi:hypothetical protein
MNKRLSELVKIDQGFEPQTLATNADVDTDYFSLSEYKKALFVVEYAAEGVIAAEVLLPTDDIIVGLFEATDTAGTGAQELEDTDGNDIEVEIPGGSHATEAIIHHTANYAPGDDFTVNGVNFTYNAAGYDAALRPLSYDSAADAVIAINAHFNDIVARVVAANSIHIQAVVPGETTVTVAEDIADGGSFAGTLRAIAYAEVDASMLSDGFSAVAINVENDTATAAGEFSVTVIRGNGRYTPQQAVSGAVSA